MRPIHGAALMISLFVSAVLTVVSPAYSEARMEFPHGSVELITDYNAVSPATSLSLGIHFTLDEGWHVYWKNPGDTGLPTTVRWNLPAGFVASELNWPTPRRFQFGEFVNFGYEHELLLFSTIKKSNTRSSGAPQSFGTEVSWVLCKDECNPGSANLTIDLPMVTEIATHSERAGLFSRAREDLPSTPINAEFENAGDIIRLHFATMPDAGAKFDTAIFFPEKKEVIDTHSPPSLSLDKFGSLVLSLRHGSDSSKLGSKSLSGVLVLEDPTVAITKAFSVVASDFNPTTQPESETKHFLSLFFTLCSAFLGGLILNLMPCVFPVISMKILGFVHSDGPRRAPLHGVAFSTGVLISFWILAAVMLLMRAGGGVVGWGFQFQSPRFVAFMAYLVFAIGLNFAGVFEVGAKLQSVAGKLDCATGLSGSLLSGMLATLLATPCTAPFMASALGVALGLPATEAIAIFTAVGVGMSAPYLILPCFPRVLRFLPRPGEWLNGFKQFLAFPMFATTCWLIWILAQQVGSNALTTFIFGFLPLTFGLWLYGRWAAPHRRIATRRAGAVVAVLLLAITLENGAPSTLAAEHAPCTINAQVSKEGTEIVSEEFSTARLQTLLEAKRPVLVDFSAAWCLTCQVNHKMAFNSLEVAEKLRSKGVVVLRGDWTSRDQKITEAIQSYGRAGVPLTVLHIPGKSPAILPALFTAGDLLNLLDSLEAQQPMQLAFEGGYNNQLKKDN